MFDSERKVSANVHAMESKLSAFMNHKYKLLRPERNTFISGICALVFNKILPALKEVIKECPTRY